MILLSILLLVIVLYLLDCARQKRTADQRESCTRCGNPVANDDLLCSRCHELVQTHCPSCGRSKGTSFRYCPWCGADQDKGHRHA